MLNGQPFDFDFAAQRFSRSRSTRRSSRCSCTMDFSPGFCLKMPQKLLMYSREAFFLPGCHVAASVRLKIYAVNFRLIAHPNRIRRGSLPAISCSCVKIESPQTVEPVARQNSRTTGLLVKGMTCGNCARHVTEAIQGVSGVRSATVSLENKQCHGALESRRGGQHPRRHRGREKCRLRGEGNPGGCLRRCKLHLPRSQAQELAMESDSRHRRHRAFDDWRMGFRPRHDAVVSMAFVRARRRGAGFCRRAILSRRVEPAQDRQFQHGHARRARLHDGVWLQRVGVARGRGRASLFHGSRRHHHAHQHRTLDRGPRERQGRRRVEIAAQPCAANGEKDSEVRSQKSGARKSIPQSKDTFVFKIGNPQSAIRN